MTDVNIRAFLVPFTIRELLFIINAMDKKLLVFVLISTLLTLSISGAYLYIKLTSAHPVTTNNSQVKGTMTPGDEKKKDNTSASPVVSPAPSLVVIPPAEKRTIFVTSWNLPKEPLKGKYDEVYYFGVNAATDGINMYDQDYKSLENFRLIREDMPTYLTIKMINTDTNLAIFKSEESEKKVIDEALDTAEKYDFDGVVLDLEMGVLPFDSVVADINTFVKHFNSAAHVRKLKFMETMYGDVFYKKRPFDVKFIAENSDQIIVMAYDMHKSNGDAGPNFPLAGKEKFGYDLQTMITDFKQLVPSDKLTIIFGMYGYDWLTNYKGEPTQSAKAMSLNEITAKYLNNCQWTHCIVIRDPQAEETLVTYEDVVSASYVIYHKIWFEDQKSAQAKIDFLLHNGINKYGYWAYGYF
jgi:hypothetical protein